MRFRVQVRVEFFRRQRVLFKTEGAQPVWISSMEYANSKEKRDTVDDTAEQPAQNHERKFPTTLGWVLISSSEFEIFPFSLFSSWNPLQSYNMHFHQFSFTHIALFFLVSHKKSNLFMISDHRRCPESSTVERRQTLLRKNPPLTLFLHREHENVSNIWAHLFQSIRCRRP